MTACKDCGNIKNENGTSVSELLKTAEAHLSNSAKAEAKADFEEALRLLMEFNGCADCKEALIQAIKEL